MPEEKKQKKEDKPPFYTTQPFRERRRRRSSSWRPVSPKKCSYYSNWKHDQDVVYWVKLSRVQDQGLRFWQTKSHAIIVHNPLPPDCIFKVTAKNGERTLFERLSTPRPAAKITLRSTWQVQQQHQQQQPAPTRLRRLGENRVEGDPQSNVKQEADSSRTEITTSVFNEIDLHVDGIPQEAILNDEIQMKDIKETLQKLQIGSQMQSMRHDLNKEDMIFCKESSKAIYEMGNVELIELRQTTSTVQCRPCWKHIPEGVLQCLCGNWLKPDEHRVNQIKLRFAELVRPYYRVLINKSRGRRHGLPSLATSTLES